MVPSGRTSSAVLEKVKIRYRSQSYYFMYTRHIVTLAIRYVCTATTNKHTHVYDYMPCIQTQTHPLTTFTFVVILLLLYRVELSIYREEREAQPYYLMEQDM